MASKITPLSRQEAFAGYLTYSESDKEGCSVSQAIKIREDANRYAAEIKSLQKSLKSWRPWGKNVSAKKDLITDLALKLINSLSKLFYQEKSGQILSTNEELALSELADRFASVHELFKVEAEVGVKQSEKQLKKTKAVLDKLEQKQQKQLKAVDARITQAKADAEKKGLTLTDQEAAKFEKLKQNIIDRTTPAIEKTQNLLKKEEEIHTLASKVFTAVVMNLAVLKSERKDAMGKAQELVKADEQKKEIKKKLHNFNKWRAAKDTRYETFRWLSSFLASSRFVWTTSVVKLKSARLNVESAELHVNKVLNNGGLPEKQIEALTGVIKRKLDLCDFPEVTEVERFALMRQITDHNAKIAEIRSAIDARKKADKAEDDARILQAAQALIATRTPAWPQGGSVWNPNQRR